MNPKEIKNGTHFRIDVGCPQRLFIAGMFCLSVLLIFILFCQNRSICLIKDFM